MTKQEVAYLNVLVEDINSKFDFLTEAIAAINEKMTTFATKEEVQAMNDKLDLSIKALMATTRQVSDHEKRIKVLETTQAL